MNDDVILVFPGGGREGSVTALYVLPPSARLQCGT